MASDLEKAKAILGISDDIREIYKMSAADKAKLRDKYQSAAIEKAKPVDGVSNDANEAREKEVEKAHDQLLSYLNLPQNLFEQIKSGDRSLENEAVREAMINDPKLLLLILADKDLTTELRNSRKSILVDDKPLPSGSVFLQTIEKGIVQNQNHEGFMKSLPNVLRDNRITIADLFNGSPDVRQVLMKKKDLFPNDIQEQFQRILAREETNQLSRMTDYINSHAQEKEDLGLDAFCTVTAITKDQDGIYTCSFKRSIPDQDNPSGPMKENDEKITLKNEDVTRLQQAVTAEALKRRTSSGERASMVPANTSTPKATQEQVKHMEAMITKIMNAIDQDGSKKYQASSPDGSGSALISTKDNKPVLSVQPEKVSLMQSFGNPPGGPEDEAKVAMLVKAAMAAFDKPILFSTNPDHKDFLQKEAAKLGVRFASTQAELDQFKAADKKAAQAGPTITAGPTHTTPPTFGNLGVDPLVLQQQQAPKELKDTTPEQPKSDFEKTLDSLRGEKKTDYLKSLIENHGDSMFEVKETNDGMEITIKNPGQITNGQAQELTQALTTCIEGTIQEGTAKKNAAGPMTRITKGDDGKILSVSTDLSSEQSQTLKEKLDIKTPTQTLGH